MESKREKKQDTAAKESDLEQIRTAAITAPVMVEFKNPELLAFIKQANDPVRTYRIEPLNEQFLFCIRKSIPPVSDINVCLYDQINKKENECFIQISDKLIEYFKIRDNCIAVVDPTGVSICEFLSEEKVFHTTKKIKFSATLTAELKDMEEHNPTCSIKMFKDNVHLGILKNNVEFHLVDLSSGKIVEYKFPFQEVYKYTQGFIFHSEDEIIASMVKLGELKKWFQIKLNPDGSYVINPEPLKDYTKPVSAASEKHAYDSHDLGKFRIEESIRNSTEYKVFDRTSPCQQIGSRFGTRAQYFPLHGTFAHLSGMRLSILSEEEESLQSATFLVDTDIHYAHTVKTSDSAFILTDREKMFLFLLSISKVLDKSLPREIPLVLINLISSYIDVATSLSASNTSIVSHSVFKKPDKKPLFELKLDEINNIDDLSKFAQSMMNFVRTKEITEISTELHSLQQIAVKLEIIFYREKLIGPAWFSDGLELKHDIVSKIQKETKDPHIFNDPKNIANDLIRFLALDKESGRESPKILAAIQKYKIDQLAGKIQKMISINPEQTPTHR